MHASNQADGAKHVFPVSVKGVAVQDRKVLLLENERIEWELPGGKLELGEDPIDCVVREISEEARWARDRRTLCRSGAGLYGLTWSRQECSGSKPRTRLARSMDRRVVLPETSPRNSTPG